MLKTNCFAFNSNGTRHSCNALKEMLCVKGLCPFYKNIADVNPDDTKPLTKREKFKKPKPSAVHKTTPPPIANHVNLPDGWKKECHS